MAVWTCLYLPSLCLQAFLRGSAKEVPAVVSTKSNRPAIVALNRAAQLCGIEPGMSIAAALALHPDLRIHLHDPQLEAKALEGIAVWAGQFTPSISLAPPNALLLEVGSCLTYFGGLPALLQNIERGVLQLGFKARLASSPTPTGALLLAHAGAATHCSDLGELNRRLATLPVAVLQSARDHLDLLRTLGIDLLGDLLGLPADGIARRFGAELLDEMRRALGDIPDPQKIFVPPETYQGQLELPAPVFEADALLFAANRLIHELTGFLRTRGLGAARVEFDLLHEDCPPTRMNLGMSPSRDADHLLLLLRERLAHIALPEPAASVRLTLRESTPLAGRQADFYPGAEQAKEARAQLVERLRARLGNHAIFAVKPHPDHRPESAWRYCEPGAAQPDVSAQGASPRPLWLLPTLLALEGGPQALALQLESGPERIESGWWDGADVVRDYYVAVNRRGERRWIFRDRQGQWFLHGIFA